MAKAAEAFRTISEVADDLDIPKYVLRFWEDRFPQIRPMKRGGGRRYYRPEDMELLRGIRQLLRAEGYTIKGVQRILREQGVDHVKLYGRETEVAAGALPAVADPAPRRKRGRAKSSSPAKAPAPQVARGELPAPVVRPLRQAIEHAIAELEACRTILLTPPPPVDQARSGRRTRHSGL